MNEMFCFQCEQTARSEACTNKMGVCGKTAEVAKLQDQLTGAIISLSHDAVKDLSKASEDTNKIILEALFTTVTNVSFNPETLEVLIDRVHKERERLLSDLGEGEVTITKDDDYNMLDLWGADKDVRSLKSLTLFGLRGMAAYAYHALVLGYTDEVVDNFFYTALDSIGVETDTDKLLSLVLKTGEVNLKCMELLDKANTSTYGSTAPTEVTMTVEKGPFIVITGHDLKDLELLLEQTKDKGINIYTHGEMLPAHGYPELKKYPHLKGNFGTAWQNQQKEFADIPAPILFTTNCLMPPKDSYRDRVFTTEVVSYPEMVHIGPSKDFTPVIEKALELGGYAEDKVMTGINGGNRLTTGFGHDYVLSHAEEIVKGVKDGEIGHFFVVGGCDGAKTGRNYYTEIAENTPDDSIILTLACGKYRFNDLDLGQVAGFPRLMDVGQCNDAYSAIKIAVALSEAFECDINDLPLSFVLSWYEQKAVCILLTLLHLGVRNILLGPTLPAFISENVLDVLVKNFNIGPISTAKEDLEKLLA